MIHALFVVIPAIAILFWLIFFYLDKRKNKTAQYLVPLLSIILLSFIVFWFFVNINLNYYHFILDSIWVFTSLSVYPLYYYYIRLLTVDNKIDYRWTWLLIPAFSLTIFSIVIYMMMTPQEIEIFTNEVLYAYRPLSENFSTLIRLQILRMKLFEIAFVGELILTVFYGLQHIIRFEEKATSFYLNILDLKLSNIRVPLILLLFVGITAMISNIIGNNFITNSAYILAYPFIIHTITFMGVFYTQRKELWTKNNGGEKMLMPTNKNREEDKDIVLDELYNKMEHLLKDEQIYRDPTLRLNDLAIKLGSNRTYVSKLINLKTNSNFSDYINTYRITYAKEILSSQEDDDDEKLTLDEIATKSGFSNLSSFYRVFTKLEETTPAKYRMEQVKMPVEQE